MSDPYPLRPISDDEFKTWARVIANTYGRDRSDADLEHERATIELDRTIAAFDGDSPVAGAAIYTRSMTIPGAVQPIAGVTWVGVSPTHRRRGILTSMMHKQLTDLHESSGSRSPCSTPPRPRSTVASGMVLPRTQPSSKVRSASCAFGPTLRAVREPSGSSTAIRPAH